MQVIDSAGYKKCLAMAQSLRKGQLPDFAEKKRLQDLIAIAHGSLHRLRKAYQQEQDTGKKRTIQQEGEALKQRIQGLEAQYKELENV